MHETVAYEILVEAVTPIAHHRESLGNHALLERRKVRRPDGSWAQVPAVSGDALRHGLREAAAYAFLDAIGLLGAESLTESALRLLFAGGMVTGRGDSGNVKLDEYHALCDVFPPLALLGAASSLGCTSDATTEMESRGFLPTRKPSLPPCSLRWRWYPAGCQE